MSQKNSQNYSSLCVSFEDISCNFETITPEAKITDTDIKELCGEIKLLEKDCEELVAKISNLKAEDFIKAVLDAGDIK